MTDEKELVHIDATLAAMAQLMQRPRALSSEHAAHLGGVFVESQRQTALERVDIYREQFWLRHLESLREDFPGTSALLASAWTELCTQYLAAHPPCTPSLRELGFQLPEFLATLAPAIVSDVAVEMARLEVAYLEVFDAPDPPVLDFEQLRTLGSSDWPGVRFELSGALRLLELRFPVADLRRALRAGTAIEGDPVATVVPLAVYRRERGLFDQVLSPAAFELLRQLGAGLPLAAACDQTVLRRPEAASVLDAHLSEWFATWARLGWIVGVLTPAD